jgi:hypothetical protein
MRTLRDILEVIASGLGWAVVLVILLQVFGIVEVLLYIGPAASEQVEHHPRKVWT